jgi:hypothetical protein
MRALPAHAPYVAANPSGQMPRPAGVAGRITLVRRQWTFLPA